ncbi:MAG: hypothetical protein WDA27_01560 [Actinomycetota bacterium]
MTPTSRSALSPRRPVPAPERPRHLEVVRGRPVPGRRPPSWFVVLTLAATGLSLFALISAQVLLGQASITESRLSGQLAVKQARMQSLDLEVARLGAPGTVAARARKLGMVPATDVVVLDRNGVRTGRPAGDRR